MQKKIPFNALPLSLLLLYLEAILVLSATQTVAKKQQCRIQPHQPGQGQVVLQPPTNTGIGGTSTATYATSITAASPQTPTSPSLPSSTLAPFDYANDKIRGVNMYAFLSNY